jgi:hypothetical protein
LLSSTSRIFVIAQLSGGSTRVRGFWRGRADRLICYRRSWRELQREGDSGGYDRRRGRGNSIAVRATPDEAAGATFPGGYTYTLSSKFLSPLMEKFSVEEQILRWKDEGRY